MRRYTAPLSIYDDIRARREHRLVRSIRYKMKKANLVLRPTDKSGVLHIGSATDYERKAIEYRAKTRAYTELSSNPLVDILHKVESVLNDLRSKKYISIKQYSRMRPNRSKTHLAYMYFIPKAHKVRRMRSVYISFLSSLSLRDCLERDAVETDHEHDQCTDNSHLSFPGPINSTIVRQTRTIDNHRRWYRSDSSPSNVRRAGSSEGIDSVLYVRHH